MTRFQCASLVTLLGLAVASRTLQAQSPLTDVFTYQGRLTDNGVSADGTYDVKFKFYAVESAGSPLQMSCSNDLAIVDGLFTVELDPVGTLLNGNQVFLEVLVRADPGSSLPCGVGDAGFTVLAQRQELTATPHATYSLKAPWSGLSGVPAGFADGVDDAASLTLPYSGSHAGNNTNAFTLTQTGTGRVGEFRITNPSSFWEALVVSTDGTGRALSVSSTTSTTAEFRKLSTTAVGEVVHVEHDGMGFAIGAESEGGPGITSTANAGYAVRGLIRQQNGSAVPGTGHAGWFENQSPTNDDAALRVKTAGDLAAEVERTSLALAPAALANDDLIVEDSDAVLGLYSSDGGSWGSALVLGEIVGGSLTNKWSLARTTSSTTNNNELRFTYGSSADYSANPTMVTIEPSGNVGIGTTAPPAKLGVEATGQAVYAYTSNSGEITAQFINGLGNGTALKAVGDVVISGAIGVGTTQIPPGVALAVDGKVLCEELEVMMSSDWPDYVFREDYLLSPLSEVESFIRAQGHLPGVPCAEDIQRDGLNVGQMQSVLLRKVEELTLHVIGLDRQLAELKGENARLRAGLVGLEMGQKGLLP